MSFSALHDMMFYSLYALGAAGLYVICERLIFYQFTLRDARRLARLAPAELRGFPAHAKAETVAGAALAELHEQRRSLAARHDQEDAAEAAFIAARARLQRHLWIVDTLVTAAPLLGLLGTILGIIDTFQALATSGISDPGAVSRGIGTALFATALGIAIALVGLLANNFFQDKVDRISECVKLVLLKVSLGHGQLVPVAGSRDYQAAAD